MFPECVACNKALVTTADGDVFSVPWLKHKVVYCSACMPTKGWHLQSSTQPRCPTCGFPDETTHTEMCPARPVPCKNAERGCPIESLPSTAEAHLRVCEFKTMPCPLCPSRTIYGHRCLDVLVKAIARAYEPNSNNNNNNNEGTIIATMGRLLAELVATPAFWDKTPASAAAAAVDRSSSSFSLPSFS